MCIEISMGAAYSLKLFGRRTSTFWFIRTLNKSKKERVFDAISSFKCVIIR